MPATEGQRLAYRDQFRSLFNDSFQSWFEELAKALHPVGDFQAIRKTSGDGGLDGFVINSQLVYQIYAPIQISDSKMASKIREDFHSASSTLTGQLKAWVFVHNHPEAKIGKLSAAAVSALKTRCPNVEITILDINSLWEKLKGLADDMLTKLFGNPGFHPGSSDEQAQPGGLEALLRVALSSLGSSPPNAPFQVSVPVETAIPPTPSNITQRSKVVGGMLDVVRSLGVLVLIGSTGTGKTTLAKLTANKCGGSWIWMSFAVRMGDDNLSQDTRFLV